jgi:CDP-diacylglycerol--glycerol-3-phosphate 3-phosphatidyltransferase
MKAQIPNILTGLRLVLCLVMFAAFAVMASRGFRPDLLTLALVTFVVAAVTDFFDGYLARKWNVVSTFGAIMDPIADKVLVCGAILGLLLMPWPGLLVPSGVILFREFAVSAMREVLAPKGIKLPVTFLAKTKTTLQLVALAAIMGALLWTATGDRPDQLVGYLFIGTQVLYGVAAAVTLWTGIEYGLSARKALAKA